MGEQFEKKGTLYYMNYDGEWKELGRPHDIELRSATPISDEKIILKLKDIDIEAYEQMYQERYVDTELLRIIHHKLNLCERNLLEELVKEQAVDLPERYIINKNATILFWKDGEKTVVRRCEDDEFNPRLAFLTAFFQHYCGMSKNKANKYLASLEVEEEKKEAVKESEWKSANEKLNIGDKVKVRSDLKCGKYYGGLYFNPEMKFYKGKIVTISENYGEFYDGRFEIEEDDGEWHWDKEMFEAKRKPKHMKEGK